jgi:hypothetical protein
MSDTPAAPAREPDSSATGPEDNLAAGHGVRKPWWQRAIVTPVVLGSIGVAFLLIAFFLYPRTTELPSPAYPRLGVSATFPIAFIDYTVVQVTPTVAEIKMQATLPTGTPSPPARAPAALLAVSPPFGVGFRSCRPPACQVRRNRITEASFWIKRLTFRPAAGSAGEAAADFFVNARSFGVTSNGTNASAAIPEVVYDGPGTPMLLVLYRLQSASSYDWSASPVAAVTSSAAQWQQNLMKGDTPGRAAVGIDHAAQTGDDIEIFVAGALLGIAGGAIVAAVQEAMHLKH